MEFLRTAVVVSANELAEGVTGVRKVLLKKGSVRMHGVFRHRRERKTVTLPSGRQLDLRDDCRYEVAAYQLSRLIGLDNVPPVVERTWKEQLGTLQVWIEASHMEKERRREGAEHPDPEQLRRQYQMMGIFDNLIHNDDRHEGNILLDSNGKLWMIDHTRAFRTFEELSAPVFVVRCETGCWNRLRSLDVTVVREKLEPYLEPAEIEALLVRRELLIEAIEDLIEELGESEVLFSVSHY